MNSVNINKDKLSLLSTLWLSWYMSESQGIIEEAVAKTMTERRRWYQCKMTREIAIAKLESVRFGTFYGVSVVRYEAIKLNNEIQVACMLSDDYVSVDICIADKLLNRRLVRALIK